MHDPRQLLISLLDYVREQAREVTPQAFQISALKGFNKQRGDLAGLPGLVFDIRLQGDHVWLRVPRLLAEPAPEPSPQQRTILRISAEANGPAPFIDDLILRREIGLAVKQAGAESSDDIAKVEARLKTVALRLLDSYTKAWSSWSLAELPRRKTIALYGDLFSLMHQMEAEQTSKPAELVWGFGISSWQIESEKQSVPFEYPLLTQLMEISIDEKTMAIDLRPRATDTRVEMDAFIKCQVPGAIEAERTILTYLSSNKDRPITPFDPASYAHVLKLVASNLDSHGVYKEILAHNGSPLAPDKHLVVTDAWVLLSRPRTINFLFDDLKRLQERLNAGCALHKGPLALVSSPSDQPLAFEQIRFRGLSGRGSSSGKDCEELYFPLPYNDEQVTIIQKLKRAPGVTVQGPPGTGKTHTIANVICHYLASGKRVLVTSRGEPALALLQDKIPEDVRALTVALLTSDREGVRQFQGSIESIQHRVSQLNPELTRQEIDVLRTSIDRAHSELISIDQRIDMIAVQQLSAVEVDGISKRAQELAELVVSGQVQHGWFDDSLTLGLEHSPPLSTSEAALLRDLRRKVGCDLVYVDARTPSPDSLPSISAVGELHEILVKREGIEDEVRRGTLLPLKANTPEVFTATRQLLIVVEEMLTVLTDLNECGDSWPLQLRDKCSSQSFSSECAALESLLVEADNLIKARRDFLQKPVVIPEASLADPKVGQAVLRASEMGKPFGFVSFGSSSVKEQVALIRVEGRSPSTKEDWLIVQRWLVLHEQVLTFTTRWNQIHDLLAMPRLAGGVTELRKLEIFATLAQKAHRLGVTLNEKFRSLIQSVFETAPRSLSGHTVQQLESIRQQLMLHLTFAGLSKGAMELNDLQEKALGKSGPASEMLQHFIESVLGRYSVSRDQACTQYSGILAEVRRISILGDDFANIRDLARKLEDAGASLLAARVRSVPVPTAGDDRTFPITWREAWNWARIRTHIESIECRDELLRLFARRRDVSDGLARFYREIVAKTAWLATKQNATPKTLQALAGYATAVRRIGQGTGPNATRYRRDAREMMFEAASAVPCWIMNHSRISEAMPAEIGAFDLVIVDEASQSDLWSLPAILRGKQVLVVGDDKQVSPDGGFIESSRIQDLLDRFLANQPYGAEMTPEKSLYDLAARVFAADQIMLREHFRCVPPIIEYSNRTFYQGQIQPLRIPRASERLEPPLIDIYVEHGARDHRDRNDREAQAIADEISAILEDQAFAGRTIGVVSLLGMEQAKHVDSVVNRRCDSAELHRRKFLCGDARTFQGSERHIMFLSMVVDAKNCKALSGAMFDQRFNVAASRAQDRMYLVRSVLSSELSPKDIRSTLLSHFEKPLISDSEEQTHLLDLCESGFERQVFAELSSRGFRVLPQVKTGAYRLDMVVEGGGDVRLAIECDGDEFHGPDRWQHDMNRQRTLERAGWTFWRCFASTWSMRKDEVLAELLQRLQLMGIEPLGAIDGISRLVETRTWRPKETPELVLQ